MAKHEPILADQLAAISRGKIDLPPKVDLRAVQARIRRAERMVFDTAASQRVGAVLRDIPELLIEQIQFARAPFDLCFIEYKSDVVWEAVSGYESNKDDRTSDEVVGLLIDHNRVSVFSRTYGGRYSMLPWVYHMNTEWPLQDQLRFCEAAGISRLGIDMWLWGGTANHFMARGQLDRLRVLRDTTMVEFLYPLANYKNRKIFHSTNGDYKNIVALLLMLNQPRVTQYLHVPPRRGWIGNKPKPFLSHHNVTVSLDAQARVIVLSEKGEGELRRRHRVRGHYCHDQTARDYARIAGCVHEWQPMDEDWEPWPDAPLDEREHWKCRVCDGKRWWRIAHERGAEEKGYVEHQYQVTTGAASCG
jgi:hypothetical protein